MPDALKWTTIWPASDGQPDVSFARSGDVRYFNFTNLAMIAVDSHGVATVAPAPAADPALVRHVLLDQWLPLALASDGELVLHASAVGTDDYAVLFVGDAGSGKSTLAAAVAQHGFEVLADDGVLLEERDAIVYAVPSYPGLRLWPDSAEAIDAGGFVTADTYAGSSKKRLHPPHARAACARPVAIVYSLNAGPDDSRLAPLSRRDTALQFIRHAFTPDPTDRRALRAQLDRASRWSGAIACWSVARGGSLADVADVARAIAQHVRGLSSGRLLIQ